MMCCIRQIDLTSIWGVLEIHSTFRNLLRWATRVLRPSISCQISRWRLRKDEVHDPGQMFVDTTQMEQNKDSLPSNNTRNKQHTGSKTSEENIATIASLNRYIEQMEMHNETLQGRVSDLEDKLKDRSKGVDQPMSDAMPAASAGTGSREFAVEESQQTQSSLPKRPRDTARNATIDGYAKSVSHTSKTNANNEGVNLDTLALKEPPV